MELPVPSRFDPAHATPAQWARWHAFRRTRHAESDPEEPFWPDAVNEMDLSRENPEEIRIHLAADTGSEIVAAASFEIPRPGSAGFESNRGIVWFGLYVLEAARGQGLARSFLKPIAKIAREHECRVIGTGSQDPVGEAAVLKLGMEKRFAERKSRLDLQALDWAMVEGWAADGAVRNPALELVRNVGLPPEAEWPAYAQALTELFADIPWEGLEHGDVVFTPETMADLEARMRLGNAQVLSFQVKDASGAVLGLTEMALWHDQPEHAWQWLTAVRASARNRGIGRWLKAEMLLHVREQHPRVRWVLTDNAGSNAPMLKINDELGFAPYRVATYYQMPFSEFEGRASRT